MQEEAVTVYVLEIRVVENMQRDFSRRIEADVFLNLVRGIT